MVEIEPVRIVFLVSVEFLLRFDIAGVFHDRVIDYEIIDPYPSADIRILFHHGTRASADTGKTFGSAVFIRPAVGKSLIRRLGSRERISSIAESRNSLVIVLFQRENAYSHTDSSRTGDTG